MGQKQDYVKPFQEGHTFSNFDPQSPVHLYVDRHEHSLCIYLGFSTLTLGTIWPWELEVLGTGP